MNYFIDVNGKHISIHDHVHHSSRTDHVKYDNRRGIIVAISQADKEATVWFYDTRESEFVKWEELIRPIY